MTGHLFGKYLFGPCLQTIGFALRSTLPKLGRQCVQTGKDFTCWVARAAGTLATDTLALLQGDSQIS